MPDWCLCKQTRTSARRLTISIWLFSTPATGSSCRLEEPVFAFSQVTLRTVSPTPVRKKQEEIFPSVIFFFDLIFCSFDGGNVTSFVHGGLEKLTKHLKFPVCLYVCNWTNIINRVRRKQQCWRPCAVLPSTVLELPSNSLLFFFTHTYALNIQLEPASSKHCSTPEL